MVLQVLRRRIVRLEGVFGGWSHLINLDGFEERRYLVRLGLC